jgi:ADP-heptose:LPS heptosyltransferase
MKLERVLILRFSSIGDIVLTTPVVRCLKNKFPGCEIHYVTKTGFTGILTTNPNIDKVFSFNGDLGLLISELKKQEYDLIIDLHHNLRTARIKSSLRAKSKSFNKLNIEKWMMVQFKLNFLPKTHIVNRYINTLSGYGINYDGKGLDYFIDERDEVKSIQLGDPWSKGYVAMVVGAKHGTKRMPASMLAEIAERCPGPVVLLGGREDFESSQIISGGMEEKVFNACGKFSLAQSASLVRQARMVITHDTGLMHIAAAFGQRIISLWGNTIPEFGMYPFLPEGKGAGMIFENRNLRCRPCSKIGYDRCPKGHFKCMKEQDIGAIVKKVEEWWGEG